MKVSQNFDLAEFIDQETYKKWGEKSIYFIDRRIVDIAQFIRERFKLGVTINNWNRGGNLSFRGFRPPACTVGATLSQHRFGRALDCNVEGIFPRDVAKDIINNFDIYKKIGITTIEDPAFTETWTHIDCRQTGSDELLIVKP